jgi:hypothetical protein
MKLNGRLIEIELGYFRVGPKVNGALRTGLTGLKIDYRA